MVISYGVRGASSKPIAGTGLPSRQPKFATSISEPVRFIASAATSELRRPMGDAPRERRDRAGLGGFTRSVALSSESKEEGPGRPPGQHIGVFVSRASCESKRACTMTQ